jgi:hypothetical protein
MYRSRDILATCFLTICPDLETRFQQATMRWKIVTGLYWHNGCATYKGAEDKEIEASRTLLGGEL